MENAKVLSYIKKYNRKTLMTIEGTPEHVYNQLFTPSYANPLFPEGIKKQLPALILGRMSKYRMNTRKSNIMGVNFLAIDIDGIPENVIDVNSYCEKVESALIASQEYNSIHYRTVSYRPEQPRYRVLFPLHTVKRDPATYPHMVKKVVNALFRGIEIDECSYKLSQIMFLPHTTTLNPEHVNEEARVKIITDRLHIDTLLAKFDDGGGTEASKQPKPIEPDMTELVQATNAYITGIDASTVREMLKYIPPNCDYHKWIATALSLKHEAGADPDRQEDFASLFMAWSRGDYSEGVVPPSYLGDDNTRGVYDKLSATPSNADTKPRTIRSLIHDATQKGYIVNLKSNKSSPTCDINKWIYLTSIDKLYHIDTGEVITRNSYNVTYAGLMRKNGIKEAADRYMPANGKLKIFHDVSYQPGKPSEIDTNGTTRWNSYLAPTYSPPRDSKEEVYSTIEEIKAYLSGTVWPGEGQVLFDILAWLNQHPDKRLGWMTVLQGGQGVGKSFFTLMAELSLGEINVNIISSSSLVSGFTSWAHGSQLNVIEELSINSKEKRGAYNMIKQYITGSRIAVNVKGLAERTAINTASYVATTNLIDGIRPEHDDRRCFVLASTLRPDEVKTLRKENFFRCKFDMIRANPSHVKQYLMNYKIHPKFDEINIPFQSRGTMAVKKATLPPVAVHTQTIVEHYLKGTTTISVEYVLHILEHVIRHKLSRYDRQNVTSLLLQSHGYTYTNVDMMNYGKLHDILSRGNITYPSNDKEKEKYEAKYRKTFVADLKKAKVTIERIMKGGKGEDNINPEIGINV